MTATPDPTPAGGTATLERPGAAPLGELDWVCVVWDDPVNLMSYVTYVFVTYFKYPKAKAERLMMEVHTNGKSAVAAGTRDEVEAHVSALQGYGLWATVEPA